jgi:hypothetical protein
VHDHHSGYDGEFTSGRGKRRFDDEPTSLKRVRRRRLPQIEQVEEAVGGPAEGDRWSTWDQSTPTERGPRPYPDWLVTELAAVDTRPSGTGPPSTGCSTGTAATWRDAGPGISG